MEIEAKFRIPDEQAFQRLLETTTLAGFTLGEAAVAELHDRYLDTADRTLLEAGFACRLRQEGNRVLATVKGLGGASGAVHRRSEDEVKMDSPLPPADWPASAARDLVLRLSGGEPLSLLFEIEQTRHSRPLCDGDRLVAELGLDRVQICRAAERDGRGPEPLACYLTLEAELAPEGQEEDLARLTAELEGAWGLEPDGQSKFERALALAGIHEAADEEDGPNRHPHLTPDERGIVELLAHEREVISRRARLLLAWDEGLSRAEMIQRSGLSPRRARYWRMVFQQRRMGVFPRRMLQGAGWTAKPVEGHSLPSVVLLDQLSGADAPAERPEEAAGRPEEAAGRPEEAAGRPEEAAGRPEEAAEQPSVAGALLPGVATPTPQEPRQQPRVIELLKSAGIEADDPMSEAGRKIIRFHYRRMLFNEAGTRLGEDIEALHDMRVATRRMRAAFRVFGDHFEPEAVAPLLKGLKLTGEALGAVRDLDVFREKIEGYRDSLPDPQRGSLDGFLAVLDTQRDAARARMIAWLDSGKYRRLVGRFDEFVETPGRGAKRAAEEGGEPQPYRVRHVAPMAIYERLAAVRAYDDWVSSPNPPVTRLHALRIASKRLRYTLEFFAEVLAPETRQVIKAVVAMQDHLGELQDAVVASGILREYLVWGTWGPGTADRPLPGPDVAVIAPGVALYLAVRQSDLQRLLATFPPIWQWIVGAEFSRMVADAVAVL